MRIGFFRPSSRDLDVTFDAGGFFALEQLERRRRLRDPRAV